jgi:molybdenum cofactor cytidylyltransferase
MSTLAETLDLRPGALVALVGAGNATGIMQRLVLELGAAGRRGISTATVPTRALKGVPAHPFLIEPDPAARLAQLPALLAAWPHVRVAAEAERADKIRGLAPADISALRALPGVDYVLVEADGARHRALKAPAAHEPALPPDPSVVLIGAGLDALGAPLDEDHVHRPDVVATLTGLAPGAPITPEAVAAVLTHPAGGLKDIPATARTWVVLTEATPDQQAAGRDLAALILLAPTAIRGVILLPGGPVATVTGGPLVVFPARG